MRRATKRWKDRAESGFTLIEVVIAMVILSVGLLAAVTAQVYALQKTAKSRHLTRALHLAQEQMEAFNSMPLASLPASGADAANPIDPDPNDADTTTFARSWVVEPNVPEVGVTRVTVNVTWLDENGLARTTSLESYKAL